VNIVVTFQKMRNIFPDFLFFGVKVDKTAYLLPFFYTMTFINSVKKLKLFEFYLSYRNCSRF